MFVPSPHCGVRLLSFPSVDDQGLESGSLWWNQRPTLHAGKSSTVFGHVETDSHIKDPNLIMKDCSAFLFYFEFCFISGGGTTGKSSPLPGLSGGWIFSFLFPGRSIL